MSTSKLNKNNRGVAAIEMVIILPVLALLIFGGIEFGLYFVKQQITQRAVSMAAVAIQRDPTGTTQNMFATQNSNLVRLDIAPNYICARAFLFQAQALANSCGGGTWVTSVASPIDNKYYVKIVAQVEHTPIAPIVAQYLGDIIVSTVAVVDLDLIPPVCTGDDEALRFDGDRYTCEEVELDIPDCPLTGFALKYDRATNTFTCTATWNHGIMWWYTGDSRPVCQNCDVCANDAFNLQNWGTCPDKWTQHGLATCGPIVRNGRSAQKIGVLCRAPSNDVFE